MARSLLLDRRVKLNRVLFALLPLAACSGAAKPPAIVDLIADSNRSGLLELDQKSEDDGEDIWSAERGAVFLANLDDDDGDGKPDSQDTVVNGANDLLDLSPLQIRAWPDAPAEASGKLVLNPAARSYVRIFRVVGDVNDPASYQAESGEDIALSRSELVAGAQFAIEGTAFRTSTAQEAWNGYVDLELLVDDPTEHDLARRALLSDRVRMRVAPVLFQYNTAPTETLYYTDGGNYNKTLADGVKTAAALAGARVKVDPLDLEGMNLDWDQWTQDFFDVGYTSRPGPDGKPHGMKVAIRSAQPDRSAGRVTTEYFLGPDWAAFMKASDNTASNHGYSMNSFGNWDVIPPYEKTTEAGTEKYPLGRNFWGSTDDPAESPDEVFADFVRAQAVQPAFNVNTSWLGVGHVDEFTSWAPTKTARGWGLLLASPRGARNMLMSLEAAGHGGKAMFADQMTIDWQARKYVSAAIPVSAVLKDPNLMAASQTAQTYIDSESQKLIDEIGLAPDEVTLMPYLFEESYGGALAYQPGTVNMLHVDGKVVVPDPFGPVIDGVDPFKQDLEERLGALGLEVVFADDWEVYHLGAGEVHCGTNASRNMTLAWWESGR